MLRLYLRFPLQPRSITFSRAWFINAFSFLPHNTAPHAFAVLTYLRAVCVPANLPAYRAASPYLFRRYLLSLLTELTAAQVQ